MNLCQKFWGIGYRSPRATGGPNEIQVGNKTCSIAIFYWRWVAGLMSGFEGSEYVDLE